MTEVTAQQLRHLGMREAPPCPVCGKRDWKYLKHDGVEPLKTVYVMATCPNHRGVQLLWRSTLRMWERMVQGGGVL